MLVSSVFPPSIKTSILSLITCFASHHWSFVAFCLDLSWPLSTFWWRWWLLEIRLHLSQVCLALWPLGASPKPVGTSAQWHRQNKHFFMISISCSFADGKFLGGVFSVSQHSHMLIWQGKLNAFIMAVRLIISYNEFSIVLCAYFLSKVPFLSLWL